MHLKSAAGETKPVTLTILSFPERIREILRINRLFFGHGLLPDFGSFESLKDSNRQRIREYDWVTSVENHELLTVGILLAAAGMITLTAIASVPLYYGFVYANSIYGIVLALTGLTLLVVSLRFGCLPQVAEENEKGPFKSDIWHKHISDTETAAWQKVSDNLLTSGLITSCELHVLVHSRHRRFGFVTTRCVKAGIVYALVELSKGYEAESTIIALRVWQS